MKRLILTVISLFLLNGNSFGLLLQSAKTTEYASFFIYCGIQNELFYRSVGLYKTNQMVISTNNIIYTTNGLDVIISTNNNAMTNYPTKYIKITNNRVGNFVSSNVSYYFFPEIGIRYMGGDNMEWGIKTWGYGISGDVKWQFYGTWLSDAFSLSANLEAGHCFYPAVSKIAFGIIMDYQMFKTLGLFFSARFTSYIDWSYWLYIEPYQNIVFIPTVGIKLFADKDFSIVGEAGIEKVFEDDILKFIKLGLSIRYRLK